MGLSERVGEAWRYAREGGQQRDALVAALAPGESLLHAAKAVDGRIVGLTERRLLVSGGALNARVTSYGFAQLASVTVTARVIATKIDIELNVAENNRYFFVIKPKAAGLALGNDLAARVH